MFFMIPRMTAIFQEFSSVVTRRRGYFKGLFQFGQIYLQTCESDNCREAVAITLL
jgi:hypothetical protein